MSETDETSMGDVKQRAIATLAAIDGILASGNTIPEGIRDRLQKEDQALLNENNPLNQMRSDIDTIKQSLGDFAKKEDVGGLASKEETSGLAARIASLEAVSYKTADSEDLVRPPGGPY